MCEIPKKQLNKPLYIVLKGEQHEVSRPVFNYIAELQRLNDEKNNMLSRIQKMLTRHTGTVTRHEFVTCSRMCSNCGKQTMQTSLPYNNDDPTQGQVWQCAECNELIDFE